VTAPAPAPETAPAPDAQPAPDPEQQQPEQQPQPDPQPKDTLPDDPAALKAEIARLRRENGTERTTAKQKAADDARAAMAQEIGKALGLIQGDDKPDPEKLTQQLTATQQEARAIRTENAVLRMAGTHGADPDALTDSRSFLAKLGTLDPAADDFSAQVDAAIKDAVAANPKLRAGRVPGASGADHTGGPGEQGRQFTPPTSLHEAVAAQYRTAFT
jgi:hypothetical protein